MEDVSGGFPGSPQGQRRFLDASEYILMICVLFLGQCLSMEFNRAGVSSGLVFEAKEAELVEF